MIRVIDNYHPDPATLRAIALRGKFHTEPQGGAYFQGIQVSEGADWGRLHALAEIPPKFIVPTGQEFFRLYTKEMEHPTYIHTDDSMARFTGLLYLNPEPQGGTAFWDKRDGEWVQTAWIESKWNRLLLFDSRLHHSRYPEDITEGLTPETGRLIQVLFF